MLVFKRVWDFSEYAVITRLYHIIGIFEEIQIKYFAVFDCVLLRDTV
jgi:hypothetical protein